MCHRCTRKDKASKDVRKRSCSKAVKNNKDVCFNGDVKFRGKVNLQYASLKPVLETSVFIGMITEVDSSGQPKPNSLGIPYVANVHGDYTFDCENGISLFDIINPLNNLQLLNHGNIKGVYTPLSKDNKLQVNGLRMVLINFIIDGVPDPTFFWQVIQIDIEMDESLIKGNGRGFSELFEIDSNGAVGNSVPDSKTEFIQTCNLFQAPFNLCSNKC
jgi:hypothetical protein